MHIAVVGGKAESLLSFRGNLIQEMVRRGHRVTAMAPGDAPAVCEGLATLGAAYRPLPVTRTGMNPLADLVGILRMARLFRSLRPDMVFAYTTKPVVFGIPAAWLARVPERYVMITGRGTPLMAARGSFLRTALTLLYRKALRLCRGVIFQNHDDRTFFLEEGILRAGMPHTVVSGSGVDVVHFGLVALPGGPPTFLFVGRMLRDKGIQDYLEACRRLRERKVEARFLALGPVDTNPSAVSTEELVEGCRAGGVDYLGESLDVRPALAEAHVLVLPSRGEGTPRSVLEAMSMGRAIITTHAPGCRETVEENVSGLLVPVGEVEALTEAMARLAQDRSLLERFGTESRRIAVSKYEVGIVTGDVLAFLDLQPIEGGR